MAPILAGILWPVWFFGLPERPRMIEILNPAELAQARITGALVADILPTLKSRSAVGNNLSTSTAGPGT